MTAPKQSELASKLEQAFALYGFAEPNVAKLKGYTGTTLKTLYKYFPSKEQFLFCVEIQEKKESREVD